MAEVALASHRMRMSLKDANDWVGRLVPCYEHVFTPDGNPGKRFDEVYDIGTVRPVESWQKIYEEVKAEIKTMGLQL